jgi:hypothetical protein
LIHGKEQKLDMSKREEVVPRYKSASSPYYEDEKLKEKVHN